MHVKDDLAPEKLALLAKLGDITCELNHGPEIDNSEKPKAVNYITIPIENQEDPGNIKYKAIAVCTECIEALNGSEWTLLYCLECASSQWIAQSKAKLDYKNKTTEQHYNLLCLKGCPRCTGEFGGLYFLDDTPT